MGWGDGKTLPYCVKAETVGSDAPAVDVAQSAHSVA